MLINSVIFVLQETLEAALLISVLLTINFYQGQIGGWIRTDNDSIVGSFIV